MYHTRTLDAGEGCLGMSLSPTRVRQELVVSPNGQILWPKPPNHCSQHKSLTSHAYANLLATPVSVWLPHRKIYREMNVSQFLELPNSCFMKG